MHLRPPHLRLFPSSTQQLILEKRILLPKPVLIIFLQLRAQRPQIERPTRDLRLAFALFLGRDLLLLDRLERNGRSSGVTRGSWGEVLTRKISLYDYPI